MSDETEESPDPPVQYVNFWPIKQVAYAWQAGHAEGMPVPRNLKL